MGGIYINPQKQTAQEFLAQNGTYLSKTPTWGEQPVDYLPALIAHNGIIEIGVICDSREELLEWIANDLNPKYWYFISIEKLPEVTGQKLSFFIQ